MTAAVTLQWAAEFAAYHKLTDVLQEICGVAEEQNIQVGDLEPAFLCNKSKHTELEHPTTFPPLRSLAHTRAAGLHSCAELDAAVAYALGGSPPRVHGVGGRSRLFGHAGGSRR